METDVELLDYFAGQVLLGAMGNDKLMDFLLIQFIGKECTSRELMEATAKSAYRQALIMLEERKRVLVELAQ